MNDVAVNKKESIERCIKQIHSYCQMPDTVPFEKNFLKQDAIAINIQRACEQAIDLANHTIRKYRLGMPKNSRDSFKILAEHQIISADIEKNLCNMIGFRNILVHQYQQLDLNIMTHIIKHNLNDLLLFSDCIFDHIKQMEPGPQV
jgi:uncharacterized protein YutE (UPF0331/DUF86 family)